MQALWSSKMIPGGGEIRRLLESSEDSSSGAKYGFTAGFTVAFIAAVVLVCCLMQIVEQYFLQSNHPSAGSSSPALRRIEHVVSLPVRIYDAGPTSSASDTTSSEVEVCAICLGEFEKGESVSVLPLCKHIFHKDCIKQWVPAKSINCPICRSPTVDGDEIPARTTGRVAEMVGADYSMPPLPAFFTLSLSARMTIYSNTGRRL